LVSSSDSLFASDEIAFAIHGKVPLAPDRVVFGVDVSQGPDAASLTAAWFVDDRMFGVLIERRTGATDWVGEALRRELVSHPRSTVVIGAGPSILVKAALVEVCQRAGVELIDKNLTNVAGAAMKFNEYMVEHTISIADEGNAMLDALEVAKPRVQGDRWRFDRVVFGVDQSPVIALSLAVEQAWAETFTPTVAIY
jgi:hypothetical protein